MTVVEVMTEMVVLTALRVSDTRLALDSDQCFPSDVVV